MSSKPRLIPYGSFEPPSSSNLGERASLSRCEEDSPPYSQISYGALSNGGGGTNREVSLYVGKIRELESILNDKQILCQELRRKVTELNDQVIYAQSSAESCKDQESHYLNEISKMRETIAHLNNDRETLMQELSNLRHLPGSASPSNHHAGSGASQIDLQNLLRQLDEKNQVIIQNEKKYQEALDRMSGSVKMVVDTEVKKVLATYDAQKSQDLNGDVKKLRNELSILQSVNIELTARIKSHDQDLSQKEQQFNEEINRLNQLVTYHQNASNNGKVSQEHMTALMNENVRLQHENGEYLRGIEVWRQRLIETEKNVGQIIAKERENVLSALEQEYASKIREKQNEIDLMNIDKKRLNEALIEIEDVQNDLRRRIPELEAELMSRNNENSELRAKLSKIEGAILPNLNDKLQALELEMAQSLALINDKQRECEILNDAVNQSKTESQQLQDLVYKLKTENQHLHDTIIKLKSELTMKNTKTNDVEGQLQNLSAEIQRLREEREHLVNQNVHLQQQAQQAEKEKEALQQILFQQPQHQQHPTRSHQQPPQLPPPRCQQSPPPPSAHGVQQVTLNLTGGATNNNNNKDNFPSQSNSLNPEKAFAPSHSQSQMLRGNSTTKQVPNSKQSAFPKLAATKGSPEPPVQKMQVQSPGNATTVPLQRPPITTSQPPNFQFTNGPGGSMALIPPNFGQTTPHQPTVMGMAYMYPRPF